MVQGSHVLSGDAVHLLPPREMEKWRKNVLLMYFDILN